MKRISTWQARWTFLKAAILLASILYLSAVDELERLENAVGAAMCGVLFLSILIPLCRISRSNGNQETAGLDVILALLDPANGHRWDQMPFTIRRPKGKRLRTVISILFWEAFVLFWGIFWQVTGQMTPELLESWGIIAPQVITISLLVVSSTVLVFVVAGMVAQVFCKKEDSDGMDS